MPLLTKHIRDSQGQLLVHVHTSLCIGRTMHLLTLNQILHLLLDGLA